jgi:hypothetical protein
VSVLKSLRDSLRKYATASRVLSGFQRLKESLRRSTVRWTASGESPGSETIVGFGDYANEWFRSSTVARGIKSVTGAAATVEAWVVNSSLYRWLTTEPDPDVIVIDLRETYTVGPFLRAVDRVMPTVGTAVRGSFAWSIAERMSENVVEPAAESRSVQWLAAVLAPPEPPEAIGDEVDGREGDGPVANGRMGEGGTGDCEAGDGEKPDRER